MDFIQELELLREQYKSITKRILKCDENVKKIYKKELTQKLECTQIEIIKEQAENTDEEDSLVYYKKCVKYMILLDFIPIAIAACKGANRVQIESMFAQALSPGRVSTILEDMEKKY